MEACNDVFADIISVLLLDGRLLVNEEELDDESLNSGYNVERKLHVLERDVAKH